MINIIGNALVNSLVSGSGGNSNSIGSLIRKLEILYNNVDYPYITTSATFPDTVTLIGNVISINKIGVSDSSGANTGLTYNFSPDGIPANDSIGVKTYNNNRLRLFPKSLLPPGTSTTIPTPTVNLIMQGSQGTAIDNINNRIFECLENTQEVRITDLSNNEIEKFSIPEAISLQPSTLFYDIFTDILYITINKVIYKWKKIGGVWTNIGTLWFNSEEGTCVDWITGKIYCNRSLSNSAINRMAEQDLNGWFNVIYPFPTSGTGTVHEALIVDPRDGTIWFNSDQNFHGGVTDANRLWRVDLKKTFRKKIFIPDMIRFDRFNFQGKIIGQFNNQVIESSVPVHSPIIDFEGYTEHHNILNWINKDGLQLEFRGSNSSPTTTPENSSHLNIYNANQSNIGWGDTVPSSYSTSVNTSRYLQFNAKPKEILPPITTWSPADIGSDLKLFFLMNSKDGMYYDPNDSNRIELLVNKYNTSNYFSYNISSGPTSKPTFVEASSFMTGTGTQYLTLFNPAEIANDTIGEFGFVMRSASGTTTNQVVALALSNPATANGYLKIGHYRSNESNFANAYHVTHVDNSGVFSRVGFVDTDHATFKHCVFASNGITTRGFLNNIEQTVITSGGVNNGKWLSSTSSIHGVGNIVIDMRVWRTSVGINPGLSDAKVAYYIKGRILTTQERTNMHNYLVNLLGL